MRDSGIVHALLRLPTLEDVLGHPVAGGSWEGFVIESLLAAAPGGTDATFYRTSAGAEIDLVLTLPGDVLWAIEIKRGSAPKVGRGFHQACSDLIQQNSLPYMVGRSGSHSTLRQKLSA